MDRASATCERVYPESPRAWGWTGAARTPLHGILESPRAWGWTEPILAGDAASSESPRAWGWTGRDRADLGSLGEFPRAWGWTAGVASRTTRGDPHARGDGPPLTASISGEIPTRVGMDRGSHGSGVVPRSPRAWGWTGLGDRRADLDNDPHARGDGPVNTTGGYCPKARSPRAWGWTGQRRQGAVRQREIPTRVGMDRSAFPASPSAVRDPTRVGIDRRPPRRDGTRDGEYPRAWGWTAGDVEEVRHVLEIPTRVGMDRTWRTR